MKSQLAALQGTVPTAAHKAPQGQFARYVAGDIKGGEVAHDFRASMVHTAILEAYKGNARNLIEAQSFTVGKSKKARAYQAGFATLADVAMIPYAGKLDTPANADIKARIHAAADASSSEFEIAFLSVFNAPSERATKAAVTEDAASPAASPSVAAAEGEGETAPAPATVEVGLTMAVEAVVQAVQQGLLMADEIMLLRAALAAHDAAVSAPGEYDVLDGYAMLAEQNASASAHAH